MAGDRSFTDRLKDHIIRTIGMQQRDPGQRNVLLVSIATMDGIDLEALTFEDAERGDIDECSLITDSGDVVVLFATSEADG